MAKSGDGANPLVVSTTHVEIALPIPLPQTFTYEVPPEMQVEIGSRVAVRFGPRRLIGIVVGPSDPEAVTRLKRVRPITASLDDAPLISPAILALTRWMADYWYTPLGEALATALPPRVLAEAALPKPKTRLYVHHLKSPDKPLRGHKMQAALQWIETHGHAPADALRAACDLSLDSLRRLEKQGLIRIDTEIQKRVPMDQANLGALATAPPVTTLTDDQQKATARIKESLGRYEAFLLHGVTGSGKTEVYLALIKEALQRGEGAIVLVPEIALTPQLSARFKRHLGDEIAIQHSGLDPAARYEQWEAIRSGDCRVVVGARSALFAPMPQLGLIVVDEEHESSFKQDRTPRYHARDLALVRGHQQGIPVILGSATPSLESWVNVERGKLTRLSLPTRAHTGRSLPQVELIDMREASTCDPRRLISTPLADALSQTLAAGQQSILFLNRRGYATAIQCLGCGDPIACPHCSVSLTWHQSSARFVCHYCDTHAPYPQHCPQCRSQDLLEGGAGTEHAVALLQDLFPDARIARMDRDTTRGQGLVSLLHSFQRGDIDILVGTQMVAKGHDFPNVTLVGVLHAEQGLSFPDFRAAERTFHLLTQISGRAGRAAHAGRVLIQTYLPDHYAITHALEHDTTGFLTLEAQLRQARHFPPSRLLALFRISGPRRQESTQVALDLGKALRQTLETQAIAGVDILPPQPAPIEKIKSRFRYQILIRAQNRSALRRLLDQTRPSWQGNFPHDIRVSLDIDPTQFL